MREQVKNKVLLRRETRMISTARSELDQASSRMLVVYADGACRGNPGSMAIGATVQTPDGDEIDTVSEAIGEGTNNIAEYRAAIEGVKKAIGHGATRIELRMDSELVVKQLNGEYQVKNARLKPLWTELKGLLASFEKALVVHVPREKNKRADELANLALDKAGSVLDEAEQQLAARVMALVKESRLRPARMRLVLTEVTRSLKQGTGEHESQKLE